MYNLVLDFHILKHFLISKPKDVLQGGSIEENDYWNSFYSFIKKGAHVEIVNFEIGEIGNIVLNNFTSGRGVSNLTLNEKKINFHNFKVSNKKIHTILFLNEINEENQLKYRSRNGYVFGFINDYAKVWKQLSLVNDKKIIAVGANSEKGLKNWSELSKLFNQVTDVVFIDAFAFESELKEYNIIKILELINQKSVGHWNLTIISSQGKKSLSELFNRFNELNTLISINKINCDLKVVFTGQKLKEHDRQLILNNIRINSGDSFNYFDSNGKIITKGTEMHLMPLVDNINFEHTSIILNRIRLIEDQTYKENIFGNCKNRFLEN